MRSTIREQTDTTAARSRLDRVEVTRRKSGRHLPYSVGRLIGPDTSANGRGVIAPYSLPATGANTQKVGVAIAQYQLGPLSPAAAGIMGAARWRTACMI